MLSPFAAARPQFKVSIKHRVFRHFIITRNTSQVKRACSPMCAVYRRFVVRRATAAAQNPPALPACHANEAGATRRLREKGPSSISRS